MTCKNCKLLWYECACSFVPYEEKASTLNNWQANIGKVYVFLANKLQDFTLLSGFNDENGKCFVVVRSSTGDIFVLSEDHFNRYYVEKAKKIEVGQKWIDNPNICARKTIEILFVDNERKYALVQDVEDSDKLPFTLEFDTIYRKYDLKKN